MTLNLDDIVKLLAIFSVVAGVWWRLQLGIAQNRTDLAEFKLDVAKNYASVDAMKQAFQPLLDELHALRNRIDKLIDRDRE